MRVTGVQAGETWIVAGDTLRARYCPNALAPWSPAPAGNRPLAGDSLQLVSPARTAPLVLPASTHLDMHSSGRCALVDWHLVLDVVTGQQTELGPLGYSVLWR